MLPEECAQKSSLQGTCTLTNQVSYQIICFSFPKISALFYKFLFDLFFDNFITNDHHLKYYIYYLFVYLFIIIICLATADACLSRRRFLRLWRFGGLEDWTLLLPTRPWHISCYGNGTVYFLLSMLRFFSMDSIVELTSCLDVRGAV